MVKLATLPFSLLASYDRALAIQPGQFALPTLGDGIDIRSDVPRYRVWRDGVMVEECTDVRHVWRDDLVSFAIGCSFSFEEALIAADLGPSVAAKLVAKLKQRKWEGDVEVDTVKRALADDIAAILPRMAAERPDQAAMRCPGSRGRSSQTRHTQASGPHHRQQDPGAQAGGQGQGRRQAAEERKRPDDLGRPRRALLGQRAPRR